MIALCAQPHSTALVHLKANVRQPTRVRHPVATTKGHKDRGKHLQLRGREGGRPQWRKWPKTKGQMWTSDIGELWEPIRLITLRTISMHCEILLHNSKVCQRTNALFVHMAIFSRLCVLLLWQCKRSVYDDRINPQTEFGTVSQFVLSHRSFCCLPPRRAGSLRWPLRADLWDADLHSGDQTRSCTDPRRSGFSPMSGRPFFTSISPFPKRACGEHVYK